MKRCVVILMVLGILCGLTACGEDTYLGERLSGDSDREQEAENASDGDNDICEKGQLGCPCFRNQTCDAGLTCNADKRCVQPKQGELGGPCYRNLTCKEPWVCTEQKLCAEATKDNEEGGEETAVGE